MDAQFQQVDFGPLRQFLDNDDVTDISYSNGGQVWLKTLSKGVYRVENTGIDNALIEKIAFQCANTMGKAFNMANPFLDAESAELRLNFVHDSIARNGVALLVRKTPAKIRLKKDQIIADDYIRLDIHDFLMKCVEGHCNILVSGETGSGKTEFIKYLASHTKENEKIITIEDTLELHLDRIFPTRDIVAMKTNNIASYSDVLVTCMRQNPRWILLSEVRSAEAVMAVRNSISSGHNILSTIHADKAASIPSRLYSLLESNIDLEQFLRSIHRYVQLGVHIKGYYSPERQKFHREIAEVVEFYVTDENEAKYNILYKKTPDGHITVHNPTKYLLGYLESQGLMMQPDILVKEEFKPVDGEEENNIDQMGNEQVEPERVKEEPSPVAETPTTPDVSATNNQSEVMPETVSPNTTEIQPSVNEASQVSVEENNVTPNQVTNEPNTYSEPPVVANTQSVNPTPAPTTELNNQSINPNVAYNTMAQPVNNMNNTYYQEEPQQAMNQYYATQPVNNQYAYTNNTYQQTNSVPLEGTNNNVVQQNVPYNNMYQQMPGQTTQ